MAAKQSRQLMVNRRKLLSITAVSAALGAAYYFGVLRQKGAWYTLKSSQMMMGTYVNFTIVGPDEERCREGLQKTVAHMQKEANIINMYTPESPLSRLNRSGIADNAHPTLIKVVRMAKEMAVLTGGAFDPTVLPLVQLHRQMKKNGNAVSQESIDEALTLVDYDKIELSGSTIRFTQKGMGITLDGIGKGYVVDEGVKKINELGFTSVCVEAGGDLMVTGAKRDGSPWTIAIRNPRPESGSKQYVVKLKNRAIATSGDYMQSFSEDRMHHHIINPKTGFSPPELASCSILAPTVAKADGLATAAMVMGPEDSINLLNSLPDCDGFLIGKDLTTHTSKDFFS